MVKSWLDSKIDFENNVQTENTKVASYDAQNFL